MFAEYNGCCATVNVDLIADRRRALFIFCFTSKILPLLTLDSRPILCNH